MPPAGSRAPRDGDTGHRRDQHEPAISPRGNWLRPDEPGTRQELRRRGDGRPAVCPRVVRRGGRPAAGPSGLDHDQIMPVPHRQRVTEPDRRGGHLEPPPVGKLLCRGTSHGHGSRRRQAGRSGRRSGTSGHRQQQRRQDRLPHDHETQHEPQRLLSQLKEADRAAQQ